MSATAGYIQEISLYGQWEAQFQPLLGKSLRWEGFKFLMRDQLERKTPVILETGTLREPGNWLGDGQSTRLWQWILEHKEGMAMSVDLNVKACQLASRECDKVLVTCMDSVTFLRGFMPFDVTLLYLDSMAPEPGKEVDCWMNQIAELSSIWYRLSSGCLIASDDCLNVDRGKHVLTRYLFDALGIQPVHVGYITVWRKP